MILAASIIFGSIFGWRRGATRSSYIRFTVAWLVVLALQTSVLLALSDDVRNRSTGEIAVGYPALCAAIYLLGLGVVTVTAALRRKRAQAAR